MTSLCEKRYEADMRQFGGLLMTFASLVTMNSLTTIAKVVAADATPNAGKPLFDLIAALCLCTVGIVGVIMGYFTLVQDRGWTNFSLASCVITQLAWLPFLGGLVGVGMASQKSESFNIDATYDPTSGDIKFVGAMGILSIMAYASAFVGSMSFVQFAIYAYQAGNTQQYGASYFRGRLGYYSSVVCLAGFAQMSLGSYIISKFGGGPLVAPIVVGPMAVSFPEISIFVGLFQLCVGTLGITRRCGLGLDIMSSQHYSFICIALWIIMLSLQIMVQIGYPAGPELVAMAPTLGCMYFALAFAPAYLDFKATTVPDEIDEGYYLSEPVGEKEAASEQPGSEKEAASVQPSGEKEAASEQAVEKESDEEKVEKVV